MRKLDGVHEIDVTGRDPGDVAAEIEGLLTAPSPATWYPPGQLRDPLEFEKWQALGNDYADRRGRPACRGS